MIRGTKAGRIYKQIASYATASAARSEAASTADLEIEKIDNGVTVASVNRNWPMARISILFRAGSRHEDSSNRGMTHLLRRSAGLSTSEHTAFGLTRSISQLGAGLQCSSTREHMVYSLDVSNDCVGDAFELLASAATRNHFYHWELKDQAYDIMKRDVEYLQRRDNTALLFDRLHEVAYKTTLGRSLYAPLHKIGDHSIEMIEEFLARHFVPERTTLVGVGIDHSHLKGLAKRLNFPEIGSGNPVDEPARFRGGESRIDLASPLSQVALVSEGAKLSDGPGVLAHSVLAYVLGHGSPNVLWGANGSPLSKAVAAACQKHAYASSINLNYSDSGAFGFYVISHSSEIGAAVKAGREVILNAAKSGVKPEDLQRAKNQLKSAILLDSDSITNVVDDIGTQVSLLGDKVTTAVEMASQVDAVTADQVNQVAKKLLSSKAAISSVGAVDHVPYLADFV